MDTTRPATRSGTAPTARSRSVYWSALRQAEKRCRVSRFRATWLPNERHPRDGASDVQRSAIDSRVRWPREGADRRVRELATSRWSGGGKLFTVRLRPRREAGRGRESIVGAVARSPEHMVSDRQSIALIRWRRATGLLFITAVSGSWLCSGVAWHGWAGRVVKGTRFVRSAPLL